MSADGKRPLSADVRGRGCWETKVKFCVLDFHPLLGHRITFYGIEKMDSKRLFLFFSTDWRLKKEGNPPEMLQPQKRKKTIQKS